MATIHKQFTFDTDLETAWSKISDVEGVASLISLVTDATVEGDRRVCTTVDGGRLDERILAVDDELKRVAYSIVDSPFGLEFHAASWQLRADGDRTVMDWFTDVKPDAMAEVLEPAIEEERAGFVASIEA